mgnify:CR=1 FL=1
MSLLDDVSIVITPNAYNVGELYAVIPVPTEGAEEITNGDFSNGLSDWVVDDGTSWTNVNNTAFCDGNNGLIKQGFTSVLNKRYKVTFDVVNVGGGELGVRIGSGTYAWNNYPSGSYVKYLVSGSSTSEGILFYATGAWTGSIDNVSVKEYTSADMDVTRATAATRVDENGLVNYAEVLGGELVNTIVNDITYPLSTFTDNGGGSYTMATTTTAYSGFEQPASDVFAVQVGEIYKLTFDFVLNSGALDLELFIGSGAVGSSYGNRYTCQVGSNTAFITIITSNSSAMLASQINQPANMTISNIVLKKVDRDNVPRIDYTGGGCPHILAEPQRTNLIPYSEDFSSWTTVSATLTPNQLSPDGTNNAYIVEDDNASGFERVDETITTTATPCTLSVFIKKKTSSVSTYSGIQMGTGFSYLIFDSYNGTYNQSINTNYDSIEVENFNSDWWRLKLTATVTTSTRVALWGAISTNGTTINTSATGSETFWGTQLEQGSYATSYIPNFGTAAGVTRNQDIFTRDGIGSLINYKSTIQH